MTEFSVCPKSILADKHLLDSLAHILREAASKLAILHLAVGFVNDSLHWDFPPELQIDCPTVDTRATEGLLGLALTNDRDYVWRDDPETHTSLVGVGGVLPAKEIAVPIRFNGKPTGALFVDIMEGEPVPGNITQWREDVVKIAGRLSTTLDNHPTPEKKLRETLNAIVDECVNHTASLRGYVAVKRLDGPLEYFCERDANIFLNLNPNQGLCGQVLRTGRVLNEPDVSKNPNYISSDTAIKSELIVPIKDQSGETIAILNLERTLTGEFENDKVEFVSKKALDAVQPAMAFRALTGTEDPLGEAAQEAFSYRGDADIQEFGDFLRQKLVKALSASDSFLWLFGDQPPRELETVFQGYKGRAGKKEYRDSWILYGHVGTFGSDGCVIAILVNREPSAQLTVSFEQVCRIASQALELRWQEEASRKFESLVRDILATPNSAKLHQAMHIMKEVTLSYHCTLYGRSRIDELDFLALAASTSETIFRTAERERLYRLGLPYDGLAGLSATTGQTIAESSLSDTTQDYWNRLEKDFSWKTGMAESEERPLDITAFVCRPIIRPSDGKVVGVFRLFRNKMIGQRGDYDAITHARIEFFCELVGRAYGEQGIVSSNYSVVSVCSCVAPESSKQDSASFDDAQI